MTVGYQNRHGVRGDLPTVPKIIIANHILEKICGFSIGENVLVEYLQDSIIISKFAVVRLLLNPNTDNAFKNKTLQLNNISLILKQTNK